MIELYVLDGGQIDCADFALFSPDLGPGVHRTLSVRAYLVVHPRGTLMWDTGLPDRLRELPDGLPVMDMFVFRGGRRGIAGQLGEIGVDPAGVDYLALSHLHNDHVGNVDLFPRSTVLVQRAERDAAYGSDAERYYYEPDTYAALDRERIQVLDGDHDVFGDGTVVLESWPGHTPGHQGLFLALEETGPLVLGADLAHSVRNFDAEIVSVANFDQALSIESIRAARALIEERRARLWLHHDLDQQAGLREAPAAYR